jgi:diguanylate cyclase (GGDEF)-like protein
MEKLDNELLLQLITQTKIIVNQTETEAINVVKERNYLRDVANIDPLTGLNNRRALDRVREFSGVLMMDVDDFKQINDNYGHATGDSVLQKVAMILKKCTRFKDCVCRYGGDEFTIIFDDCPREVIITRAEEIRENISTFVKVPNPEHIITTSIGLAFPEPNDRLEHTIRKADTALYISKTNGKNQINISGEKQQKLTKNISDN